MVIVNLSQVHVSGAQFNFNRKTGLSTYGSTRDVQARGLLTAIQGTIGSKATGVVLVPHADSSFMLIIFSHWLRMYGRVGMVALNVVTSSGTITAGQLGELTNVDYLYPNI